MSIYPSGIGQIIPLIDFNPSQINILKHNLPTKLIIRVYGLAGVGKGTLSDSLAKFLAIPNIDSGKVWRAITYIYSNLNLEINDANTDLVFSKLQTFLDADKVGFQFQGEILTYDKLKNGFIDSRVSHYARNLYAQSRFFQHNADFYLNVLNQPFVYDGRGSNSPDVTIAEDNGFKIVRVLVDCSDTTKWQRYYQAILRKDPSLDDNDEVRAQLREEFEINIIQRNIRDIQTQQELGNSLITADSGILINDNMNVEQMTQSTLAFINQSI